MGLSLRLFRAWQIAARPIEMLRLKKGALIHHIYCGGWLAVVKSRIRLSGTRYCRQYITQLYSRGQILGYLPQLWLCRPIDHSDGDPLIQKSFMLDQLAR